MSYPRVQNRADSKVVKGAIIFAIYYVIKELYGFEIDSKFIEACITIGYAAYSVFAAFNDAKTKNKF